MLIVKIHLYIYSMLIESFQLCHLHVEIILKVEIFLSANADCLVAKNSNAFV